MSCSIYRGKLYTTAEIKGPFTEAKDDFGTAYELLRDYFLQRKTKLVDAAAFDDHIILSLGDLFLVIGKDGFIEVGEGAA